MNKLESYCCYLEGGSIDSVKCDTPAEWKVISNDNPREDWTESCSQHVGYLLGDASSYTVVPIKHE